MQWNDLNPTTHTNFLLAMGALAKHTDPSSLARDAGNLIDVSHTNIYLMNTVSRLLLGQALASQNQGSHVTAAESQMFTYLTYIKANGVHEFDSPTYAATQMESLAEGYRYAASANDCKNRKIALDYPWLDLAANFFPRKHPRGRTVLSRLRFPRGSGHTEGVAGSHRRLGDWQQTTGTKILSNSSLSLEAAELLDNVDTSGGYQVPASTYQLATVSTVTSRRRIYQTWGNMTATWLPTSRFAGWRCRTTSRWAAHRAITARGTSCSPPGCAAIVATP